MTASPLLPKPTVKPATTREKIARLREAYLAQLPERVRQARALFRRLQKDGGDRDAAIELHRLLHSLKGSGGSFGFHELGSAALQGEKLLIELVEGATDGLPSGWQQALGRCVELVEMTVDVICSPGGVDHGADGPAFSLAPDAGPAEKPAERRLVYLCDDEPLVLEQLANQLACFGFATESFSDPQSLREAVLAHSPDAVIMDINFPQGYSAGTEALLALGKESDRRVPAFFLSARDDFAARLQAVRAGGGAYFHKPARTNELVAVLDDLTSQQPVPYRVLIVDDEQSVSSYHSLILQEAGMITYMLNEPTRVLAVLAEFRPDMVLMDIYMPDCNGRDVAMVIRQIPEYIGLPIVYLSAEADLRKQFFAMRVGADGFLTKPVIPEDLVDAVAVRAERMRTLRSLMSRDSLTGLLNHTTTMQVLDSAISAARRNETGLCFAMIDIDHFKSVNDTHGHPVGDQVILALSRVLKQRLRKSDIVGRYGGEEFAVILQDIPLEKAVSLIDDLRKDFARVSFHSEQGEFNSTFSAGIACLSKHRSLEQLRDAADKVLYEAKRSGRNCVVADSK